MQIRFSAARSLRGAIFATGAILALGGTVYAATEGVPGIRSSANGSGTPPPAKLHVRASLSRSVIYTSHRPDCATLRFVTTLRSRNTVSVIHGGKTVASHYLGWQKNGFHTFLWCTFKGHRHGLYTLRVFATNGHQSARASETVTVRR
jgi:hypothetical protein